MTNPALTRQQIVTMQELLMRGSKPDDAEIYALCTLALSALSEPKGWRPVEPNSMPPNDPDVNVLVRSADGYKVIGAPELHYKYACGVQEGDGCYWTHWQPLPAPPAPNAAQEQGSVSGSLQTVAVPDPVAVPVLNAYEQMCKARDQFFREQIEAGWPFDLTVSSAYHRAWNDAIAFKEKT